MSDVIINQYLGDLSGFETISEIISGSSVNMRSGQDQIAGDKQSAMMDNMAVTLVPMPLVYHRFGEFLSSLV